MKNRMIWRIAAVIIVIIAIIVAINMMITKTPLEYSLPWHWVFIGCFIVTLLVNIRGRHLVGLSIGLGGLFLLVTSLVIRAL